MEKRCTNGVLRRIRRLASVLEPHTESDQELLRRFIAHRDERAFAALTRRHGPMVVRVALRTLQNAADAEDVFQATFVVLSRRARSIRRQGSLASWLYGTAYRLALKSKRIASQRRTRESRGTARCVPTPLAEITVQEAQTILDEELSRLPEKLRAPIVLCCLEGLTRDEAAQQIGCPASALKNRLEQARERLRRRLLARGLTLPCGLGAFLLLEGVAGAVPSPTLISGTTAVAMAFAAGKSAAISPTVALLAEGVLRTMLISKLKIAALVVLVTGLVGGSLGTIGGWGSGMAVAGQESKAQSVSLAADNSFPAREEATERLGRSGEGIPNGEPQTAPPAWGLPVGGLQVGVRVKDGRSRFTLGESVTLEWFIRNVGDKEYSYKKFVPTKARDFVYPTVVNLEGRGQDVRPSYRWMTPGREPGRYETRTIAPGKDRLQGTGTFEIRSEPDSKSLRTILVTKPGTYKLSVMGGSNWDTVPALDISLESGQLEFEILDPKKNPSSLRGKEPETGPVGQPPSSTGANVAALVKQLDDDSFQRREEATSKLKALGKSIVPQLETALKRTKSAEIQRRLDQLLEPYRVRPESDLDRLQGTWELAAAQKDAKEWAVKDVSESHTRLTLTGLKYAWRTGNSGTITLNSAAKPKEMTFDGLIPLFGIYELDADTLKLCYNIQSRPEAFGTAPSSGTLMFIFMRK